MSSSSFQSHHSSAQSRASSSDRRRYWLISHGLMTPSPGPSRRLASLLPRPRYHSATDIQLTVDQHATPIVVAIPATDMETPPPATRTVSMPTDDSRMRASPFRTRSTYRRKTKEKDEHAAAGQGRRSRFLSRLKRRSKDRNLVSVEQPEHTAFDFVARKSSFHRTQSTHRPLADRKTESSTFTPLQTNRSSSATRRRTKNRPFNYTVIDRAIPSHVLQGDAQYHANTWNKYNQHIDNLAHNQSFMNYLTEPMQKRASHRSKISEPTNRTDAEQLAVNKLFPLAFIRLLEAQAKFAATSEPCDPADEEHRYDDVDDREEDDAVVQRTHSNGIYDVNRFRTVGGEAWRTKYRASMEQKPSPQLVSLIENKPTYHHPTPRYNFSSRMTRGSQFASVPVY